jgi:uncharacterized protein (TIGR02145 family)
MLAQTVTGDLAAQTTGTGKIIIWNNYADHVFFGKFYCKVELECPGVMINGVCWATCNVDMPGTFAVNHEDAGMLYQWGSNVGWSSTDPLTASDGINIWRDLAGTENLWPLEKDPCPEGWRIPTSPEVESLLETTNVTSFWTTENGIYGALITDIATANTMFLPASGFRSFIHDGENLLYAIAGIFWACSASGELGDSFVVDANGINTGGTTRSGAVSVRCVLE